MSTTATIVGDGKYCGGRLWLIATVEDPDAIRAILLAGAGTRNLAGRAPPIEPAPNTHHVATATA